uniref:Uncharacterized protein n=1 Tax=Arundo donax TaxID=35708 RepID=A0A0A8ZP89_ARUDO
MSGYLYKIHISGHDMDFLLLRCIVKVPLHFNSKLA